MIQKGIDWERGQGRHSILETLRRAEMLDLATMLKFLIQPPATFLIVSDVFEKA